MAIKKREKKSIHVFRLTYGCLYVCGGEGSNGAVAENIGSEEECVCASDSISSNQSGSNSDNESMPTNKFISLGSTSSLGISLEQKYRGKNRQSFLSRTVQSN